MQTITELQNAFPHEKDIPESIRLAEPLHQKRILINGEFINWTGPVHTVYSQIFVKKDGQEAAPFEIGSYPLATEKEAELALNAALKAHDFGRGEWPSMGAEGRIKALQGFTRGLKEHREEIVKLIVWEIAKSVADAEKEFDRTIEYIEETIKTVKQIHNESSMFKVTNGFIGQMKKLPYGVVLCMGPFNYPLNETFTMLIPALINGNSVLFKPPKYGTLLFNPLLDLFKEHFPKGVVNTVYGRGRDIVPYLLQSGQVDVLALIGSSRVADSLKKMHPKSNRLHAVLGLDAKNAAVVLPDADLEATVKEVIIGTLSFNGQRCTALKILFVHADIVDKFNTMLAAAIDKLPLGMPWDKGVSITPLAEPEKPGYLKECIDDAIAKGAKIINEADGGGNLGHSLMKPAMLYPVNRDMKIYWEEQFGPVIPVVAFDDPMAPVDYITESRFGMQASIFSEDPQKISFYIDQMIGQLGRININVQSQRGPDTFPFNGRKDSAENTLSVSEALSAFSVDSIVVTKQTPSNEALLHTILTTESSKRLNNKVIF
ncbi:MAG: NADP-dependent glyceraldehyde-3-phosphate dehydrogenase [Flavobacterium psychrophilum]|nr:MAG: NADP-dependent glyceraldehyde-3-phosphate dehydrogenase [Flavobacterium psychrophilum]